MALHSLYCADVPLRNCSLTHSLSCRLYNIFVEPNAFEHAVHRNVSAIQLAADFRELRAMLKESPEFSGKFPGSVIVGPSTTRPKTKSLDYLSRYVSLLYCSSSAHSCEHVLIRIC